MTGGRPAGPAPGESETDHGASAEAAADVVADPDPDALAPPWWDGAYDLDLTVAVVVDALRDLAPQLATLTTAA